MPLIDTTTLLRVADRAAYQYGQIKVILATITQQGVAYYWETITATDDPDVEVPVLAGYQDVDNDFEVNRAVSVGTRLGNIVSCMDNHFNLGNPPLQAGGWDGYLTDNDKRVSQYFAELYFAVKGYYMLANDVFSEGDDQFARVQVAAGPVVVFTDGINYGNGNIQNPADGTNFAATQLRVVVTTMGGTNLALRLAVKDVNDNPTTIDVTVPGGSTAGTVIAVGTSSDRFLDVIGVSFVPAGSTGTVGDDVKVRNLKERQIQL